MSLDLHQVLGSVIVIVELVLTKMLIHFAQKSNSAQCVGLCLSTVTLLSPWELSPFVDPYRTLAFWKIHTGWSTVYSAWEFVHDLLGAFQ